jgi:hypothetical protein
MGSIERRLARLEEQFPPLPEPIDPADIPVEDWVEEDMRGYVWTGLYGIEDDDEQFENWCKWQVEALTRRVGDRMREEGHRLREPIDEETSQALMQRLVDAFEPHALYWLDRFEEAAPDREAKREMHREWVERQRERERR